MQTPRVGHLAPSALLYHCERGRAYAIEAEKVGMDHLKIEEDPWNWDIKGLRNPLATILTEINNPLLWSIFLETFIFLHFGS